MWSFLDQSQSSLRNFRQKAGIKLSANQDWYLPVPTYRSTWVVLSQTLRCPDACDFPPWGHVVIFGPITALDWYLPVPTYGSTMGCALAFVLQVRSLSFPNKRSTLQGPFRGVPSLRLHSEIDHIHLSIEAQCVSHLLPLGDCHRSPK